MPTAAGTIPVLADLDPLPWTTIYELLRFRYENTHSTQRSRMAAPDPDVDLSADMHPDLLRDLIRFAGIMQGNGDPTVARHLEAHRILQLVPVEYGCALFGVPLRD